MTCKSCGIDCLDCNAKDSTIGKLERKIEELEGELSTLKDQCNEASDSLKSIRDISDQAWRDLP